MELSGDRPIFLQIYEGIEDGILSGAFGEEEQIPSITEFSVNYRINPATALKGITLLVDEGILFKKRGVGMFVASGAKRKVQEKRQGQFYERYVRQMVAEARRLEMDRETLMALVRKGFEDGY